MSGTIKLKKQIKRIDDGELIILHPEININSLRKETGSLTETLNLISKNFADIKDSGFQGGYVSVNENSVFSFSKEAEDFGFAKKADSHTHTLDDFTDYEEYFSNFASIDEHGKLLDKNIPDVITSSVKFLGAITLSSSSDKVLDTEFNTLITLTDEDDIKKEIGNLFVVSGEGYLKIKDNVPKTYFLDGAATHYLRSGDRVIFSEYDKTSSKFGFSVIINNFGMASTSKKGVVKLMNEEKNGKLKTRREDLEDENGVLAVYEKTLRNVLLDIDYVHYRPTGGFGSFAGSSSFQMDWTKPSGNINKLIVLDISFRYPDSSPYHPAEKTDITFTQYPATHHPLPPEATINDLVLSGRFLYKISSITSTPIEVPGGGTIDVITITYTYLQEVYRHFQTGCYYDFANMHYRLYANDKNPTTGNILQYRLKSSQSSDNSSGPWIYKLDNAPTGDILFI